MKLLKNQKGFSPVLILVVFAVLALGGYLYYQKQNPPLSSQTAKIDCSTPEALTQVIQGNLPKNVSSEVENLDRSNYHPSFFSISWKRNDSEPFIRYKGMNAQNMALRYPTLEEIKRLFEDKVEKEFIDEGFVKQGLYVLTANLSYPVYEYRYYKGDNLYAVNISQSQDSKDYRRNRVNVGISCGQKDPKLDDLYTELLVQPVVQNEIKDSKSAYPNFTIDEVHSNNIVEGNIHTEYSGRGGSFWIIKESGIWKKLYTGQQEPECSLLESKGIESGVECLDRSISDYRKTK